MRKQDQNNRMDMHSHLDDLTRALFANLRGGKFAKGIIEENELVQIMQMCPRCKIKLIPLKLDRFEEEGLQYERILWICPRRETRQCYFPMDMPPNVFWTKRTIEQIENNIMPLPNLHLLPKSLHKLYPKLFLLQSQNDIEGLIRCAASVSLKAKSIAKSEYLNSKAPPTYSNNSLFTQDHTNQIFESTPSPSKPQQTVRAYLKQRLRSNHSSASGSIDDEIVNRKIVDLCPNANAALNSHLLLNGSCQKQYIIHVFEPPQFIIKNVVGAGVISQPQVLRMQTQIRKSLEKLDEKQKNFSDASGSKEKWKRRNQERYCLPVPLKYNKHSAISEPTRDNEEPRKKKVIKRKRFVDNDGQNILDLAKKKLDNKLIDARFGVSTSKHYGTSRDELQEGVMPDEIATLPSEAETFYARIGNSVDPSRTNTSLTSKTITNSMSSRSTHSFKTHSLTNNDFDNANPGTMINSHEPIDTDLEEKIRRKHETLFMEAIKRRKSFRMKTSFASTTENNEQFYQQQLQLQQDTPLDLHMGTQLAGIPHDYQSDYHRMTELVPINHNVDEESATRFAAYDSFASVTELQSQQHNFDEEFDFGFGLEEEFTIGGNNHTDNSMTSDSIFLHQLSNGGL